MSSGRTPKRAPVVKEGMILKNASTDVVREYIRIDLEVLDASEVTKVYKFIQKILTEE